MSLELALRAGVPLISVTTKDTVNLESVLEALCGKKVPKYDLRASKGIVLKNALLYTLSVDVTINWDAVYVNAAASKSTVIVVNPATQSSAFYNAGPLPTPKEMVYEFLSDYMSEKESRKLIPALGGLSMKEITDVMMLTQARDGSTTSAGIIKTRQMYMNRTQGLEIVNTDDLRGYVPHRAVQSFAKSEKRFFLTEDDERLRPRGLLAFGTPGTGKSMAAKYMAQTWGVPLFRMDATFQSKWIGECHSSDTEFLTESGWKTFDAVKANHKLATLTASGELQFQAPYNKVKYRYTGDMVHLKGDRLDVLVTPNHRMLLKRQLTGQEFTFIPASDLKKVQYTTYSSALQWGGNHRHTISIPRVSRRGQRTVFNTAEFLEFLGYFLSEGHTTNKNGTIILSQNRGSLAERMIEICRSMSRNKKVWVIKSRKRPEQLTIKFSNQALYKWLNTECGRGCENKRIPRALLSLDSSSLRILLNALIAGDGNLPRKGREGSFVFRLTSKELIENIGEICVRLSMTARIRPQPVAGNRKPQWALYASPSPFKVISAKNIKKFPYDGDVVCFSVHNSTLITRRNGHVIVSGNSESNLIAALRHVEAEAPAILLFDEVEKMFSSANDAGTTQKLLGSLLWWLQEHRSRVFTFMTCNRLARVPAELYRPGRIDRRIQFKELKKDEAISMGYIFAKTFKMDITVADVRALVEGYMKKWEVTTVTPSKVGNMVTQFVKGKLRGED